MDIKPSRHCVMHNMISQLVVQFVTLIAGILVPRYIILYYGSEINGISSTIGQIINYAALLEAGLGTASIQALYRPLAKKDRDGVSAICSSTRLFYNKIGLYFSLVIFAAALIYPLFAQGETDKLTIALLVVVIAFTSIFEYFFHAKYRVLLTADQKLYIVGYSRAVGLLLQTGVKLLLIFLRVHVIYVFLVSSITLLLRILYVKWYVKRHYPWVDYSASPDRGALNQRRALVWHQMSGLVVNNTSLIVISTAIPSGLNLASIYSIYNMVISNIYNLITGAFSNGVVATFGQARTVSDDDAFTKSYRVYEFGYYIVTSIIYGAVAAMLIPFVALYTRSADVDYVSYSIAILFVIVGVLNSTRVPGGMLINAAGHFIQTRNRAILEAVINIVVMLILVWPLKIEGVLIASICSFAYRVPDIILYVNKRVLHSSPLLSIRRALRMWICVAGSGVLITKFILPSIDSWFQWLIWGVISVCITAGVTLTLNLAAEFRSFKILFNSLIIKIKRG